MLFYLKLFSLRNVYEYEKINVLYRNNEMSSRTLIGILIAAGIMVISFLLYMALANMKEEPPVKVKEEKILAVKSMTVEYDTIVSNVVASGRLASKDFVDLISESSGQILDGDVPLTTGQSFRKGQVLANIYKEEAVLLLKSKKSQFLNSLANLLPDFKIDFPDSYDKWYAYFKSIKLDKNLPELPAFSDDKEKIYLASRNILSSYYSIKVDEIKIDKHTIRAPFDGTYTDVLLEVGAVANMGSRIAKMINTNKLELEVPVELYDAKFIKNGSKVMVYSEDESDMWTGIVNRKSNYVDPNTQSISIFINLQNSNNAPLYKGQYLKAKFDGIKIYDAIEVARSIVFNHNEVFIVNKDNKLEKQNVEILKTNMNTLVINGLEEGTKLVNQALMNATANTKVKILNESEQSGN